MAKKPDLDLEGVGYFSHFYVHSASWERELHRLKPTCFLQGFREYTKQYFHNVFLWYSMIKAFNNLETRWIKSG